MCGLISLSDSFSLELLLFVVGDLFVSVCIVVLILICLHVSFYLICTSSLFPR